jgi:hypothetical protein
MRVSGSAREAARAGNGVPSFRAWTRTDVVERLNAAAARITDVPAETMAFSRSFWSSVQAFFIFRMAEMYITLGLSSTDSKKPPGHYTGRLFDAAAGPHSRPGATARRCCLDTVNDKLPWK